MTYRQFLFMLITSIPFIGFSQSYFQEEDILLSFGIGAGGEQPGTMESMYAYDRVNSVRMNPFVMALSGEYFLTNMISVGGYFSPAYSTSYTQGTREYRRDVNLDGEYERVRETSSMDRRRRTIYYGIKGVVHLSEVIGVDEKIDLFTGLSIGGVMRSELLTNGVTTTTISYRQNGNTYNQSQSTEEWDDRWNPGNSFGDVNLHIGGRYFFTDQLGTLLEIGILHPYLQIGVSYKL